MLATWLKSCDDVGTHIMSHESDCAGLLGVAADAACLGCMGDAMGCVGDATPGIPVGSAK